MRQKMHSAAARRRPSPLPQDVLRSLDHVASEGPLDFNRAIIYRQLVDNSPNLIFWVDRQGRVVGCNLACGEVLRHGSDLVGHPFSVLLAEPGEEGRLQGLLDRVLEGAWFGDLDLTLLGAAGDKVQTVTRMYPLYDDDQRVVGCTFANTEVTQRSRSLAVVSRAEERFRLLAGSVSDIVWTLDLEGKPTYVSPAVERVLGYTPEEVLRVGQEALMTPESMRRANALLQRIAAAMSSGGQRSGEVLRPTVLELEHRRKDGTTVWCEVTHNTMVDDQGRALGFAGVTRDISERRRAEQEILRLNRELEKRVEERTAELLDKDAQLRQAQKLEALGRLAGGVAHDFNNLLTTIAGYADLLLTDPELDDEIKQDVREISLAAERSGQLTSKLLTFSRMQPMNPEVLDVNRSMEELERMVRRLVGEPIAVSTRLTPGLARVKVDPGQLEQVLLNLVVNAQDAMPGGGELTLSTEEEVLGGTERGLVDPLDPGSYVAITVRDTGCGIQPQHVGQLFEPFFTTKDDDRGTGLGLSTVYGIVRQAGGGIRVDSTPGEGAAFTVLLPCTDETGTPTRASPRRPNGLETGRVLVVEDDGQLRRFAGRVLRDAGFVVWEASSGEEALEVVEELTTGPDLLLTDVVMPGISGPVLAGRLTRRWPGLRVVYMSGYPGGELARHGVADLQWPVLRKPFSAQQLIQMFREAQGKGPPLDQSA
jgi:PAS domain S-box-containing protein